MADTKRWETTGGKHTSDFCKILLRVNEKKEKKQIQHWKEKRFLANWIIDVRMKVQNNIILCPVLVSKQVSALN